MISYSKLWQMLGNRGMKRTDLIEAGVISRGTLAKMGKDESITTDTIDKLCTFLKCQPGDIMEYLTEEEMKDIKEKFETAQKEILKLKDQLEALARANGISDEEFESIAQNGMKTLFEKKN